MEKELSIDSQFVPYELAVKLKEVGFDEPCFARFRKGKFQLNTLGKPHKYNSDEIVKGDVSAPLFQQSFDWFREKNNLPSWCFKSDKWWYKIEKGDWWYGNTYDEACATYQEARLACLEKLIELVEDESFKVK